jgi:6-pyruvoyltetrahydropterin/6-carboxytetrahydropterin synthase
MKVGVVVPFDSMHHLPGHRKCGVPHGHTYKVEVTVEGPVVNGMVIDFDHLKTGLRELLKGFDHMDLNKLIPYPSCENIAAELLTQLKTKVPAGKLMLRVWEGEGKWAEAEG